MSDEINKIIQSIRDFYKLDNALKYYLDRHKAQTLLDYITNLQQENERLKRIKEHYLRYRNNDEKQQKVYNILELGKDVKNLHHHKNTGGLNWIDLPMTKFSCISSYIRARDLALEDYKSRVEKAIEYSKGNIQVLENRLSTPFCNFEKVTKELSIYQNYLELLQGGKDE